MKDNYYGHTSDDYGVYADGTRGHSHVRYMLGTCLLSAWERLPRPYSVSDKYVRELVDSLQLTAGPDDLSDEQEALDILNEHFTTNGHYFDFVDGNLILCHEHDRGMY